MANTPESSSDEIVRPAFVDHLLCAESAGDARGKVRAPGAGIRGGMTHLGVVTGGREGRAPSVGVACRWERRCCLEVC